MKNNIVVNKIQFPEFTGIKCNMMPFIQGDSSSLPEIYKPYYKIIDENYLEKGEIGLLTIDEAFVKSGKSQRGYNSKGINRNVHIEVGKNSKANYWGGEDGGGSHWGSGNETGSGSHWGGSSWGGKYNTLLDDNTMVLISNSISNTCRLWDTKEMSYTSDGDLSEYIEKYSENTGYMMKSGEVAKISIFTPHECINQDHSGHRQFFRIVGKGVKGREDYFTVNPKLIEEII